MPGVGGTCVSATNDRAVRDSEGEGPAGPELEKCLKVIDLSMWIVYAREQGSDEEGNIKKRNSCLFFFGLLQERFGRWMYSAVGTLKGVSGARPWP